MFVSVVGEDRITGKTADCIEIYSPMDGSADSTVTQDLSRGEEKMFNNRTRMQLSNYYKNIYLIII
ncbi:hypothetical protein Pint_03247 [Pistacia integerrima]|uniref:Uncharacterized protein n=1 Tax=Pistacia integerrima TaxID=434235 RepID=A0ACC0ZQ23_9ROSI|nr:hypothetical protein Pint_03247 [Pistacia integerrima]